MDLLWLLNRLTAACFPCSELTLPYLDVDEVPGNEAHKKARVPFCKISLFPALTLLRRIEVMLHLFSREAQ